MKHFDETEICFTPIGTVSFMLLAVATIIGCEQSSPSTTVPIKPIVHENRFLIPLETLRVELKNSDYQWNGPCSIEDRIPVSNAARALAYWGDPAVPILLDAIEDNEISITCVNDALSEIGIPVHEYESDIKDRKSHGLRNWWAENQNSTLEERNVHRVRIGLPATNPDN